MLLTPRDVMDQAFALPDGIVLTSQGVPGDNVTWEPPYVTHATAEDVPVLQGDSDAYRYDLASSNYE